MIAPMFCDERLQRRVLRVRLREQGGTDPVLVQAVHHQREDLVEPSAAAAALLAAFWLAGMAWPGMARPGLAWSDLTSHDSAWPGWLAGWRAVATTGALAALVARVALAALAALGDAAIVVIDWMGGWLAGRMTGWMAGWSIAPVVLVKCNIALVVLAVSSCVSLSVWLVG